MKTLFTTAALVVGVLTFAGTADAASQRQCQQYAQSEADAYAPNGQGLVVGGILGALGGAGIASVTHGNAGTGALIGGVGGAVVGGTLNQNKRQQIYNEAFYSCMNGGGGYVARPKPIYAQPQLSGSATIASNTTVRRGPGTKYSAIMTVYAGASVSIGQCTRNWCSISIPGGSGWVKRTLLY
jgi:hypothetical protein